MNKREMRLRAQSVRQHKDRVFRLIYKDKKNFLELYNALNGTKYDNPEKLIVTTLESAIYLGMKNDVSYLVYDELVLYEHQSTINPNMPLRDLLYVAHIYSDLTKDENMFGSTLIKLPAPKFIVFYNGTEEIPEQSELLLSDAYESSEEKPALELSVKVLNVNHGCNKELMEKCKSLRDYAIFVKKSRMYSQEMDLEEAIELAITECIQEGVLSDLFRKQRAEVVNVSLFEFNEDLYRKCIEEDARAAGMRAGMKEGMKAGMKEGKKAGAILEKFRIVQKTTRRGMSVKEIADILEEKEELIQQLYNILEKNPGAEDAILLECWEKCGIDTEGLV